MEFSVFNRSHVKYLKRPINILPRGENVGTTRALGATVLVLCLAVIVLHIYFGYLVTHAQMPLAFALPVTVGVLVVCALGVWLGWIMATTKEYTPPPAPEEKKEEKSA
jgi:uncharacterized membrane protein